MVSEETGAISLALGGHLYEDLDTGELKKRLLDAQAGTMEESLISKIKKGEIIEPFVLAHCSKTIIRYNESLNTLNLDSMTVSEIVRYLRSLDEDISFSEYAQKYIKRMAYEWKMVRNSVSYSLAIQSLEHFMNTDNILCAQLTTKVVNNWIADLDSKTHRAKEHYPICVRMMFRAALDELNDLEKGIVRIKNDPFKSVKIPKADT